MQNWEQTYPFSIGGPVTIEQMSGPVRVAGWDRPEIMVRATADEGEPLSERLAVYAGEDRFHLKVKSLRSGFLGLFQFETAVRLEIMVPFQTACDVQSGSGSVEVLSTRAPLHIETGSGSVSVTDVGDVDLETGSGHVAVRTVNGSAEIETGSGSIEVEQVAGAASVETGSGRVVARYIGQGLQVSTGSGSLAVSDVTGQVDLETGSGSTQVERVTGPGLTLDSGGGSARLAAIDVAQLNIEASSGGVDVELLRIYPGGTYEIETGSGGVVIKLPADASLDLELETDSGKIVYTGLPLRVHHQEAGELEGTMGAGGATLSVEAGSGGIVIRPGAAAGQPEAQYARVASAPQAPKSPMPPAAAALEQAMAKDAALESSESMKRVLNMVAEGKLSPEEAEQILRALDEEETPR